jgi:hypothetical protein
VVASEELLELVVVVGILVGIALLLLLLAMRRLRSRKAELLDQLQHSPALNADRAFNRIAMARREATILARQGADVSGPQAQIARAQSSFDLGQYDRAYELAQTAHESLVGARLGKPLPAAPTPLAASPRAGGPSARPPPGSSGRAAGPSTAASATAVPAPTGLPRNQLESQFEMKLLDDDLVSAKQARPSDPATLAAIDFRSKAESAYASGRYTEAFSYALKGRRGLGGNLGTVAPTPGAKTGDVGAEAIDPDTEADRAASASRCPNCGYPTTPDDAFCRGCGSPRSASACPRCGAPRTAADTFCGRCGERFS